MTATDAPVPAARVVFGEDDIAEVLDRTATALRSGALTLGENTRSLEALFAEQHEVPHAVAVSSGTAALEIVLRALEVEGRDVVVPTNTFAATAFAVLAAGGRPVFADVDAGTFAVSVATVEAALTPATAAVVIVHVGGLITAEITAIRELCDARGVVLVEDAAHAHGSSHDGTMAGSFGAAGTFSFYPTKVITSGEGGMIVTADDRLRDEALLYRDQGKSGFLGNQHVRLGYAWRMSEIHAAVGLVHLRRLPEFVAHRNTIAELYTRELASIPALTPVLPPHGGRSCFYKYVALLDDAVDRPTLKARLRAEHGIALSGEVYEAPLHQQPVFAQWAAGPLPVGEGVCAHHVCLPLHSDRGKDEALRVTTGLRAVLS